MDTLPEYLTTIDNKEHRDRLEEIFIWIRNKYPKLGEKIAWKQPMFTDHGTFIIGFSISKKHLLVAPEKVALDIFSDDIIEAGYDYTKQLFRIPWESPIDFRLLEKVIDFNIKDKVDNTTFWRK
ncbi:MAG: iron chaperone [Firmicutes bacterium]|nr:iron chaperone [Bacillota bacterium]